MLPLAGVVIVGAAGGVVSITMGTWALGAEGRVENGATWVAVTVVRPGGAPWSTQPQVPPESAGKLQVAPLAPVTVTRAFG